MIKEHGKVGKQVRHEMLDGLHDVRRQNRPYLTAATHEGDPRVRPERFLWIPHHADIGTPDCGVIPLVL